MHRRPMLAAMMAAGATAHADEATAAPVATGVRALELPHPEWVVVVLGAFLLGTVLVNRFMPQRRHLVRRGLVLLALWLGGMGAWLLARGTALEGELGFLLVGSAVMGGLAAATAGLMLVGPLLAWLKPGMPSIVMELLTAGAYVVATMAVLNGAGVNTAGLVTTSAILTGVLALSLQATLGNVLGGIALQLDDSIRVGDWVELRIPERIQGRVRQIGWRHTVVETRNWDTLIVPNSNLLQANFLILGKREGQPLQSRRWVYFTVDLVHSPERVIKAVNRALEPALEGVAREPAPHCILLDMASPGRDRHGYYAARYWLTDLSRDDPVDSTVRLRLHAALAREGIPFATTVAQLNVEQENEDSRGRRRTREVQDRLQAVSRVELLKPLNDEERLHLAESLLRTPFARGEVITRQGERAHHLYMLTKGSVDVMVDVEGSPRKVATLEAPTFFGEMGLMTGEPRSATLVAVTDVETFRLDQASFHGILMARPEIAEEISHILAERRVGLQSAKASPGAEKPSVHDEGRRILSRIRMFFGLGES